MAQTVLALSVDASDLDALLARIDALTCVHGTPLPLPPGLTSQLHDFHAEDHVRLVKCDGGAVFRISPLLSDFIAAVEAHFAPNDNGAT